MKYQRITKYKYKLVNTEVIKTGIERYSFRHKFFVLKEDGTLVINAGYLWDGVSGPTWDTESTMIPGLVHDALYQAIRLQLVPLHLKEEIDVLFYNLLLEHNTWKTGIKLKIAEIRAKYFYLAVKEFGHKSCIPGDVHIPKVIEV